jgi:hypothetical protein
MPGAGTVHHIKTCLTRCKKGREHLGPNATVAPVANLSSCPFQCSPDRELVPGECVCDGGSSSRGLALRRRGRWWRWQPETSCRRCMMHLTLQVTMVRYAPTRLCATLRLVYCASAGVVTGCAADITNCREKEALG